MIYILLITFAVFCLIAFLDIEDGALKRIIFYTLPIVLIFIAAFRGEDVDKDYHNYLDYFNDADFLSVEPAFVIIARFLKIFTTNPVSIFFVFAVLGVTLKVKAIKQLTELWFLALLIYVAYFFILHDLTQIRAGVASALLLLCIKPIHERNWKKFVILLIIAISFHYSSLVIIPLWFLSNKPRRLLLALAIPVSYAIYFTHINLVGVLPIPGIKEKLEVYKQLQDLGDDKWNSINVFNLVFIARILIFYFVLWKYEVIRAHNEYLPIIVKIYCVSLISFLLFATMPVFAFRFYELCGVVEILLVTQLFYVFKPAIFGKAIVAFIGLALILDILFYIKIITF